MVVEIFALLMALIANQVFPKVTNVAKRKGFQFVKL